MRFAVRPNTIERDIEDTVFHLEQTFQDVSHGDIPMEAAREVLQEARRKRRDIFRTPLGLDSDQLFLLGQLDARIAGLHNALVVLVARDDLISQGISAPLERGFQVGALMRAAFFQPKEFRGK